MHLLALGLNYQTAHLDLRERAAFAPQALAPALTDLTAELAGEAAILSTCHRTEIYCGQPRANDATPVLSWLGNRIGAPPAELAAAVYQLPGEKAVRHAFEVAAGLNSQVLGENEILGQMKAAYRAAAAAGTTGKVLNRLFQHTFSVAKQVRADTAIGDNPVSIAYLGVRRAGRIFAQLSGLTALLIGAGETVELVARHLLRNGITRLFIANRTFARAQILAGELGDACEAIPLETMPTRLADADIVASATDSRVPLLGKGAAGRALRARKRKPMCILDLAMPRDVEPEVADLPDVYLFTLDDLEAEAAANRAARAHAIPHAADIVDLQVTRFMRWLRGLESEPAIRAVRDELDAIRAAEVARAMRRLDNGEDAREVAEKLARGLSNKFAHRPSAALRAAAAEGDAGLAEAAGRLFTPL